VQRIMGASPLYKRWTNRSNENISNRATRCDGPCRIAFWAQALTHLFFEALLMVLV